MQQLAKTHRLADLRSALGEVLLGKDEAVRLTLVCLIARGHLLIEDVPGVGKTSLAESLARLVHGTFRRLQCTSDLLPGDIVGVSVYRPQFQDFEFRPALFLRISCWPMRSIALHRKRSPHYSRP